MLTVGLTGGIGSGKSEVARRLADLGAVVVDADLLAREAVLPGSPGLAAVVAEFGPGVLAADGSLDRQRMADIVFADPAARARLNAIVHPIVGRLMAARVAAAPPDAIVVHDVPLLVESGLTDGFDVVLVVAAPLETRVRRLVGARGLTESDARARIAAQAPDDVRLAAADVVITNDGDLAALTERVRSVWADLLARAGRSGGP